MITLACDPSLCAFGWVIVEDDILVDAGVIETSKITGKVTESDTERVIKIAETLKELVVDYGFSQICSESPMGSKSSSAVKALSLVKGMLLGFVVGLGISPIEWVSARDAKKFLTTNPTASKTEILEAVVKICPEFNDIIGIKSTKKKKEACADAYCVYLASKVRQ